MSYFAQTQISAADSPSIDAFSRLRTSDSVTLFDSQQQYGDNNLIWENALTGSGAVSNLLPESAVQLTNGGVTSGSLVIRQTKVNFRYQPGKSQLVLMTHVFGQGQTNVAQRYGYFNETDGIFIELNGTTLNIVKRSSASGTIVNTSVPQSTWNIDKMDGTGPSGKTLDATKAMIFVVDFQWLGVGRVRCGFDIDGVLYYVHQFLHANNITSVYMATANLPIRAEVRNLGVAGGVVNMKQICCAVISESGFEGLRGLQYAKDSGTTSIGVTTRVPILSIRAKTTGPNSVRNSGQILPKDVEIIAATNACRWELVLNPTLTGANFIDFNAAYSIAQYDTTATALSGGLVIDSGFCPVGGGVARGLTTADLKKELTMVYSGLNSVQDTLSLVITSIAGTSNVNGSITWQEQW